MKPMTANQYRAVLEQLELSQARAGKMLGVSGRTSAGYATGEHPIPEPVARLLRLCVRLELDPEDVT